MNKIKDSNKLLVKVMKISIAQLLLAVLFVGVSFAHTSYSQNMLDQKITIEVKDQNIRSVLGAITKLSGVNFLYSPELIKSGRNVSLSVREERLQTVLDKMLTPLDISYEISKKKILLKRRRSSVMTPNSDTHSNQIPTNWIPDRVIKGTVKDEKGEALPGVSILLKGTQQGTTTDVNGAFSFNIPDNGTTLVFSFVGFLAREVAISNQSTLNVSLSVDQKSLEEVVVVGYGTMKKTSVTSAISKLENKNLDQMPAGRAESALVGRMAGVNISQTRSSPGASPTITIRGPGSISASNAPLIVIDGFPGGSFDNVNMNDVESIEVLKDASSAAIYGSRGSGGVMIITTKSGKEGKPKLNLNAYVGSSRPILHGKDQWIQGGQEFYDYTARYINRDYAWTGGDPTLPLWGDPRRPEAYQVNPVIKEGNYNWEDILLNPAAIQNYSLSVSGKKNDARYYISGTVKEEKGTLNSTGFKQYVLRANVNMDITSRIQAGIMLSPNYSQRRIQSSVQNLIKMPPFLSPEPRADGTYPKPLDYWNRTVSGGANPLATLKGTHNYLTTFNNVGEVFTKFNLAKGLDFRTSFGFNISYATVDYYAEPMAAPNNIAGGSASDSRNFNWINENVLSYSRQFDKHNLNAILGASYQQNLSRSAPMVIVPGSFGNSAVWTLNNAIISPNGTNTTKSQWGLTSYFARVNYDFDSKYLFSASLRTDGSSRFGPDNRWGYFPSASAAWRISQEPFFKNVRAIDEMKIRASYGAVGNFNIGDFAYLGNIGDAIYSPGGVLVQGKAQSTFGNSKLNWERTASYDFGVEIGFLKNRLNVVVDYYNKTTKSLLYNVSIPAISGFTSTIDNVGNIENRGLELELNSQNFVGEFKWRTSYNFTWNKNTVKSIGNGQSQVINTHSRGMAWLLKPGESMFSYYAYRQAGVLQTKQDLIDHPIMPSQRIGTVRYEDVNKDGAITPADRVILGSFMPKVFMGLVNDFSYKNFDLSIAMQSSHGAKMWNLENLYYQGPTVSAFYKPAIEGQWWSEQEPGNGKNPGTSLASLEFVSNSDYYLENASFLAVRNINIGYTLPSSLTQKAKIDKLRFYLSVSNALMITAKDFTGYNPEGFTSTGLSGIGAMPGHNDGTEPINRVFVLGLNLNF